MEREYQYDNMKFILILLVVFGHLLEYIRGDISENIYRIIYTFHMPVFVFISGYFAKFKKKKIIFQLLIPYLVLQTIYIFFDCKIISSSDIVIQYVTPYWLLWFILTLLYYYLLIPLIDTQNNFNKLFFIFSSVFLSLFISFTKNIGYYASLHRFFTFLPYFIIGYYFKTSKLKEIIDKKNIRIIICILTSIIIIVSSLYVIFTKEYTKWVLYGSYNYESAYYNFGMKSFLIFLGLAWIAFFIVFFPRKKIPIVSYLGSNTFYIFILHGFFVKYLGKLNVFTYNEGLNIVCALGISILLIILLGNYLIKLICNYILNYQWICDLGINFKYHIVNKYIKKY